MGFFGPTINRKYVPTMSNIVCVHNPGHHAMRILSRDRPTVAGVRLAGHAISFVAVQPTRGNE